MRAGKIIFLFILLFLGCWDNKHSPKEQLDSGYLSPLNLVSDKNANKLYITLGTANKVAEFDIATEKVTRFFSLPDNPSGLALSPCGLKLYVTTSSADGQVITINPETAEIMDTISVGHTPTSPVIDSDGKTLYICNRFDNNLTIIDLISMQILKKIPMSREPIAAAITPDDRFLFVANHLPASASSCDVVAATVCIIDTIQKDLVSSIQLPNGSTELKGICISPDGRYAYVTHILGRHTLPVTQLEKGWVNTNALSIIDIKTRKLVDTVLLDDINSGAANPWCVSCTADGKHICVSHAGTHEISIIDRAGLHRKLNKVGSGDGNWSYRYPDYSLKASINLAFLKGLRRRIKLAGNGPRGLVIVRDKLFAAEYFTDSIGIVHIDSKNPFNVKPVALGPTKTISKIRRGEMLFNDATLCFQQWQSCGSCHPDGRADGLNWDLLNDGIGNPKNAKSLLLSHKTAPAMITGVRKDAEAAVKSGFKHLHSLNRTQEDIEATNEYIKSLKPAVSPYLVRGKLSPSAKRGKKTFRQAGCVSCHNGWAYTDFKKHDVGTGKDREKNEKFDTPTLVEVWRTGPYLLDGCAVTIKEVLTKFNKDNRHGKTKELTDEQINDLAEYVLTR